MKIEHWLMCLAVLLAAAGCKDKEEDTSNYLSGSMKLYGMPTYVKKGDVYHIVATGVYRDNKADTLLGFSWYDPLKKVTDTLRLEGDPATLKPKFDFTISSDSLATFVLSVSAWADGYYASSKGLSFTIVDPSLEDGSLTGHPFTSSTETFTDPRDGKEYQVKKIGDATWMLRNLAWSGAGKPYASSQSMEEIFGRYYTWEEAREACPAGWRLPSDSDFAALATAAGATSAKVFEDIPGVAGELMGDVSFNGNTMWTYWPEVKITNSTLFTAIPVGYLLYTGSSPDFEGRDNYAAFWTSDQNGEDAVARYINVSSGTLFATALDKQTIGASVRCIKE